MKDSEAAKTDDDVKKRPVTEADALQKIVSWSEKIPMWQRDALRRLCQKDTLEEADYTALQEIAKGNETVAQPLEHEHVPSPDAAHIIVNLRSIYDSENVNALEPKQTLSFEKGNGITIIYGVNGSGKSGYARILRSACRARMDDKDKQDIKPNIFDQKPGNPKATLEFSSNDQIQEAKWEKDKETDARLSAISVFDSDTANVHVDEENAIAYTPFPLELLRRLSVVCAEMKQRIKEEVDELAKRTPDSIKNPKCEEDTEVGKIVSALGAKTDKEKIEALTKLEALTGLSEEEKAELETLKVDLVFDSEKMSRTLSALSDSKTKLEQIMADLQAIIDASAVEKIVDIQTKRVTFEAKKAAAKAAAESLFNGDDKDKILPNLGAEAWRSLWDAARSYSEQDAYPEKPFPYTEDGAKCVLCQQDLSLEAASRLNSFETFVKGEATRQEDCAREEYENAKKPLIEHIEKHNDSYRDENSKYIRDQIYNEGLAGEFKQCVIQTKRRIDAFLAAESHDANTLPEAGTMPNYQVVIDAIQERIDNHTAKNDPSKRKAMTQRFNELEDRVWLGDIRNDLLAEKDRITEKEELGKLLKDTGTTAITNKSTELSKDLVTEALQKRFKEEIDKLGMKTLAVELSYAKSVSGSPYFKVIITRKTKETKEKEETKIKTSDISSEGEFQCIALAAFLAEQAITKNKSTIVFDDPVSSLDHIHRDEVADRLALEGKERQIVIFTHSLEFFRSLEDACRKHGKKPAYRWISRTEGTEGKVGLCETDVPLRLRSVVKVLDSLEKDLINHKYLYENGEHLKWDEKANSFPVELRLLCESAVEEAISPVLRRLQIKVRIGGLRKVATITTEDHDKMEKIYDWCSGHLHDIGDINRPLLKPEEIQERITDIREWIKSIQERQKKRCPAACISP